VTLLARNSRESRLAVEIAQQGIMDQGSHVGLIDVDEHHHRSK
jgi:hypothetical protein